MYKAMTHLATILEKETVKAAPYIKHAFVAAPDQDILSSYKSREEACVKLSGVLLTSYEGRLHRVIDRYVRFLGYLLRKNRLPMSVAFNLQATEENRGAYAATEGVQEYRLGVYLYPVGHYPSDATNAEQLSYAEVDELRESLAQSGQDPDSVYTQWAHRQLLWRMYPSKVYSTSENISEQYASLPPTLLTPELVFTQIPNITKVIQSLSRKLTYVSSAFTFEH
jgi:hypothetical protein